MGLFSVSQDDFAKKVIAELGKSSTKALTYDSAALTISDGDSVWQLGPSFADYQKQSILKRGAFLKEVTAHFLQQFEIPTTWEEARTIILPRVQHRLVRWGSGLGQGMCCEEINEVLDQWLVMDTPSLAISVNNENLKRWCITQEEAMAQARVNLKASRVPVYESISQGVFGSLSGDNHDASRMLLTDVLGSVPVKGNLIAFVPTRDQLILTGDEDEQGIEAAVKLAAKHIADASRPITLQPFRLVGDKWELYNPKPGSVKYKELANMAHQSKMQDLSEEAQRLNEENEKIGKDVYAASVLRMNEDAEGITRFGTLWTSATDSLWIPKTDYILLKGNQRKEVGTVLFDEIQAKLASRFEPVPDHDNWFCVTGFPTPEELETLDMQWS